MGGWNGSGTFSKTYSWQDDATNGIKIRADRHDTQDDDFTGGINNCITKDGQNNPTANLPMATFKHTGVGSATARDQYLTMGQFQDNGGLYYTSDGSANAYTLTPSPALTAYAAGNTFSMKASFANTAAATINVSGLGAKNIFWGGLALTGGEIETDQIVTLIYDGTQFNITSSLNEGYLVWNSTLNAQVFS